MSTVSVGLRWGILSDLDATALDRICAYEGLNEEKIAQRDRVHELLASRASIVYSLDLPRPNPADLSEWEVRFLAVAYRHFRAAQLRDLAEAFGHTARPVRKVDDPKPKPVQKQEPVQEQEPKAPVQTGGAEDTEPDDAEPDVEIDLSDTVDLPGTQGAQAVFVANPEDLNAPIDPRILQLEQTMMAAISSGKPFVMPRM